MFRKLLEHNITIRNEQFFCHLCMSVHMSHTDILCHMNKKRHQTLRCDYTINILNNCAAEKYKELLNNRVAIVALNAFMCIPCNQVFNNLSVTLNHIQSKSHIDKLKNEYETSDYNENKDMVHMASIRSIVQVKNICLSNEESLILEDTFVITGHTERKPPMVNKISYNYSNRNCETLVNNGIVIYKYHRLMCIFCYHCSTTPDDILEHIIKSNHVLKTEEINKNSYKITNDQMQHIHNKCDIVSNTVQLRLFETECNSIDSLESTNEKIHTDHDTESDETWADDKSFSSMNVLSNYWEENYQMLENNQVIFFDDGSIKCQVCKCFLPSQNHILPHIKGIRHAKASKLSNEMQSTTKTLEKTICVNESDQILLDNGIIKLTCDTFSCQLCKRKIDSLHNTLQHVKGKSHVSMLKNQESNSQISVDNNNVHENSKSNINISQESLTTILKNDINDNIHGKLHSDIGQENHQILENNQIIFLADGGIRCEFCKCILSLQDILPHVKGRRHAKASKLSNEIQSATKSLKKTCVNETDQILLDNGIIKLTCDTFSCQLCKRKIDSLHNTLQHVKGKSHVNVLKNQESNSQISVDNNNVHENSRSNINISQESLTTILKNDINDNIHGKLHSDIRQENHQILENNQIIFLADGGIRCEFCKCILSLQDILPHVKGRRHAKASKLSNEIQSATKSLKKTCVNETDQILLDNGIIKLTCDTFSCQLCKRKIDSLHNTLQHVKGKSHVNVLKNQEPNSQINVDNNNLHENSRSNINISQESLTNIWKTKINGNINEKQNSVTNDVLPSTGMEGIDTFKCHVLENKIEHPNEVQDCFYCELCNVQIDMRNFFAHINTETHRHSQLLMHRRDDIVLYKCTCCKSIIQGNTMLIHHLKLPRHLNNLTNTLEGIETKNIQICRHTSFGTPNTLGERRFSLCTVLIPKVENMTTNFVEKCLICFDISDIKLCSSLKNKICYQCSICRANLNTDHNLIEHCQGRMHRRIMKQLYPNQECDSNSNETMSVLDRFNELSIIDKKSKTSNTIDIDSVTLKAVHTEITKYIQLSPFLFNTTVMHRSNEKTLTQHLNKMYCKTYLELEEEMYTLTEKRVDSIRYSLKFLTPMKENFFYCLGCEKDVPKELHLLYEHVCSRPHRDHQIKKLSKEYVRVISKASVFCHPCKKLLQNDCQMIDNHIKKKTHKMNYKMSCTAMNDSFDSILKELNDLYYSIQRFSCILCQKNFKYKIQFIEHIIIKHSIKMEYYMFDFCIPCATLWLDNKDSYTSHCKDVIHKYLQKSKDFMIEALPECITKLLTQVDEVVNILFEQTQVLMNDNIQEEVRQSLENGIKVFFPNAKAFLFGSRTTGLGFANSDIDVYIDCGNSYYQSLNEKVGGNNLLRIESVLHTLKKEWEIKELLKDSRTPIIKLVYKRTGLDCDVSVTNGLSVENSKLIRSFNDAYLPCRKLILFVKKWFSLFNLPISHNLSNYAICWLIIFYLQTKSCLPSVAELIKEKNSSQLICGWETGFAQPKCKDICVQSVPVLLHGFFEFYAKFDYQHYIVCPLIGSLVAKKAFTELDELPKDMKPYLVHLVVSEKPEYFRIDSPLCVQDPLDLSHNLTKAVKSITVKYFKQYCQASASLLRPTLD